MKQGVCAKADLGGVYPLCLFTAEKWSDCRILIFLKRGKFLHGKNNNISKKIYIYLTYFFYIHQRVESSTEVSPDTLYLISSEKILFQSSWWKLHIFCWPRKIYAYFMTPELTIWSKYLLHRTTREQIFCSVVTKFILLFLILNAFVNSANTSFQVLE